jgi:hypothetical protein
MIDKLLRILLSPANWVGLGIATSVLVLKVLGLVGIAWQLLAVLGYAAGFIAGGLWLGFPKLAGPMWEDALEFTDEGDAREAMSRALSGMRGLVQYNPENRLPASLQANALELCKSLEALLAQWERSKGALSLQEGFHARHIAISYLPDALKAYLSIPAQYASTRVLQDGKTAQDIFRDTLAELEGKVKQLADDLASQDAHAFLVHSRFLHDKFGNRPLIEAPDIPPPAEAPHAKL